MTKVAWTDEVSGEISRRDLAVTLPADWSPRQRLLAAAALLTDTLGAPDERMAIGAAGDHREIHGVTVLLLVWGDRDTQWAICEDDGDNPNVDAALLEAVGLADSPE